MHIFLGIDALCTALYSHEIAIRAIFSKYLEDLCLIKMTHY